MATYVALLNFTQQGLQNIQQSPQRAAAFKAAAEKAGIKVNHVLWTMGAHDGVVLFEAKDDAAATGLMLSLAGLGNVRMTTLRAFDEAEFAEIAKAAPKI